MSNDEGGNKLDLYGRAQRIVNASAFDKRFDPVRNKRIGELSAEQQQDAHELWLRQQVMSMGDYHMTHYLFLLERIDHLRFEAEIAAAREQGGKK